MTARARLYSDQLILVVVLALAFTAMNVDLSISGPTAVAMVGILGIVAVRFASPNLFVALVVSVAAVSQIDRNHPIELGGLSLYSTDLLVLLTLARALLPRERSAPRAGIGKWAIAAAALWVAIGLLAVIAGYRSGTPFVSILRLSMPLWTLIPLYFAFSRIVRERGFELRRAAALVAFAIAVLIFWMLFCRVTGRNFEPSSQQTGHLGQVVLSGGEIVRRDYGFDTAFVFYPLLALGAASFLVHGIGRRRNVTLLFVAAAFTTLLTLIRGEIFGLALGLIIMLLPVPGSPSFGRRRLLSALAVTAVVAVAVAIPSSITGSAFIERSLPGLFDQSSEAEGTADYRADAFLKAVRVATTTPSPIRHPPTIESNAFEAGSITAGASHTCALSKKGIVYCWGWNGHGQLGVGTTRARRVPTRVRGPRGVGVLSGIAAIAASGAHTCALRTDRTVYCWGSNTGGQLGDGTFKDTSTPVLVRRETGSGALSNVAAITAGVSHTCALLVDQTVYCWGGNSHGELGIWTTAQRGVPERVRGPSGVGLLTGVAVITAGSSHTCALLRARTVYCWGRNTHGQIGDGSTLDRYVPSRLSLGTPSSYVTLVAAFASSTCAWLSDRSVYCWGRKGEFRFSRGAADENHVPTLAKPELFDLESAAGNQLNVIAIAGGGSHTCALASIYAIYCWGSNGFGQLGDGTASESLEPVQVTRKPPRTFADGSIAPGFGLGYVIDEFLITRGIDPGYIAHSAPATLLIYTGWIGLAAVVLLLAALVLRSFAVENRDSWLHTVFIASMVFFAIYGIGSYGPFGQPWVAVVIALLTAARFSADESAVATQGQARYGSNDASE